MGPPPTMMIRADCWTGQDRHRIIGQIQEWLPLFIGSGDVAASEVENALGCLLDLTSADLNRLRALHFLLSPEVALAVQNAAPAALRASARSTAVEMHGRTIRGRPDWHRTLRERATAGADTGLFAYTSVHADRRQLAELRVLLQGVRDAAAQALASPGARLARSSVRETLLSWRTQCAELAAQAAHLLDHPRLLHLPANAALPESGPVDRRAAPSWWPAVGAARTLQRRLLEERSVTSLASLLQARVIEPAGSDTLFEVWAALHTLDILQRLGWRRQRTGLLGGAQGRPFATYTRPKAAGQRGQEYHLMIYAQHTPLAWKRASRYADAFEHYGLAGGIRRPDLALRLSRGSEQRWLLVEVKRTVDPTYTADSVYKVLGYIADFEPVLRATPHPHAILLVWDLPQPPPGTAGALPPGPLAVASATTYEGVLAAALTSAASCW